MKTTIFMPAFLISASIGMSSAFAENLDCKFDNLYNHGGNFKAISLSISNSTKETVSNNVEYAPYTQITVAGDSEARFTFHDGSESVESPSKIVITDLRKTYNPNGSYSVMKPKLTSPILGNWQVSVDLCASTNQNASILWMGDGESAESGSCNVDQLIKIRSLFGLSCE